MRLRTFLPVLVATAFAVPDAASAGLPPSGTSRYQWQSARCTDTSSGIRAIGNVRTWVKLISSYDGKPSSLYYQEVKLQLDKAVIGGMWRQVTSKVFDWGRFRKSQAPTYSTSAMKTGLAAVGPTYTFKATVWLKRVRKGPDATIWKYTVRSRSFDCESAATNSGSPPTGRGGG